MHLKTQWTGMEERLLELVLPVLKKLNLSLYDLDYLVAQSTLRLYISKPDSHSAEMADCVAVDRALTEPIEGADWIADSFVLEVSSPGVYRNLRRVEQFQKAMGELIKVKVLGNLDSSEELPKKLKNQKTFRGKLIAINERQITLELEELQNELKLNIPLNQIKKANVDPDWDRLMQEKKSEVSL